MLYLPGQTSHNLPFDPFKACVVPRAIGWISTTSASKQHNLAPFSQFTNLTFDPPYVLFSANQTSSDGSRKDTVRNVEATGKFVWNLATWELREKVNATAQQFPHGVDEFVEAGIEKEFSAHLPGDIHDHDRKGNPVPMVKASPVKFECVYHSTVRLPGHPPLGSADLVIGRVVAVHIAEWALTEGRLDVTKTKPIARCGYYEYAVVDKTFEMVIPGMDEVILAGLEGSSKRVEEAKAKAKAKAKL